MNCGELDELGSVEVVDTTSVYPNGLQNIIDLFVSLPDEEKRETLISYAEQTGKWRPKAMTSILCRGLEGATLSEVLDLPSDFVPKIIGAELVRARSHTVYYVLTRMKGICTVFRNRKRAEEA